MTISTNAENYQHLNGPDKFLVCCFYTENYKVHAMRLKKSLETFNLNYYFEQVNDEGFWEANTRIKPHFIQRCLERFPNFSILYLDADALVKKPLDYFNQINKDVAFYYTKGMPNMSHDYLASTMFFNNTPATRQLVQQWISEQKGGKRTQVDQDSLDAAMQKMQGKISIEPLNPGYIKIFDKDYDGEVYIEQYQASREQTKLRRQLIRQRNRIIGGIILLVLIGVVILAMR